MTTETERIVTVATPTRGRSRDALGEDVRRTTLVHEGSSRRDEAVAAALARPAEAA